MAFVLDASVTACWAFDDEDHPDASAAFEADVWEIINETQSSTYSVTNGNFTIQKYWWNYDWLNLANGWLTEVQTGNYLAGDPNGPGAIAFQNLKVEALVNDTYQDYALVMTGFGGNIGLIPEPVTLAGVFLGIGSLATYLRKRRAS